MSDADFTNEQVNREVVGVFTTTATGSQNNFSVEGASFVRCNNASLLTITGFAAGVAGQRLTIVSVGAGQVDLANQSGSSTDVNRIINGVTGTISLAAGSGRAVLIYDATTQRWRVIEHEQGAWITPVFSAGEYTGVSPMVWTVDAGDIAGFAYLLCGRSLHVRIAIQSSSISGTPGSTLRRALPVGLVGAPQQQVFPVALLINNGTFTFDSYGQVGVSGTVMEFVRVGGLSVSTNTTGVYAQTTIEVT